MAELFVMFSKFITNDAVSAKVTATAPPTSWALKLVTAVLGNWIAEEVLFESVMQLDIKSFDFASLKLLKELVETYLEIIEFCQLYFIVLPVSGLYTQI